MNIEFHTGVADKIGHACRVLRKAQGAGATVVVCGEVQALDRLDVALWTFDPSSFVAHARLRAGATATAALARTPTWLVDDPVAAPNANVLVNLGPQTVDGYERFPRVIEIVSAAADDRAAGHSRWRWYEQRPGVELIHHALGAVS
jgi:DNA polymerase III subunit chi